MKLGIHKDGQWFSHQPCGVCGWVGPTFQFDPQTNRRVCNACVKETKAAEIALKASGNVAPSRMETIKFADK